MPVTFAHFEALRAAVLSHPDRPVFKLPKAGAVGCEWVDVAYTQFQADIERMARFWYAKLSAQEIPSRSVVGIWLRGSTYEDTITIFGVSRAGYIPQLFVFEFLDPRLIFELLPKSNGKALIYDRARATLVAESKAAVPCHVAVDNASIMDADVTGLPLPELPEAHDEDVVFIYHTSGSVSGIPKAVPTTNKWLSTIEPKSGRPFCIGDFEGQDIYIWTGSFCYSMQICLFVPILHRAGCLARPIRKDCDSRELVSMIRKAGVNRIIQFANLIRRYLEDARRGDVDSDLLSLLKQMRQVTYAGMPISTELEDWAVSEGIPITTTFGTTECGQLLTSVVGDRRLEMVLVVSYKFVPVNPTSIDGTQYDRLLELWILPDSPDIPVPELCSPDGCWRSGDLFEELAPGKYSFKGRDDDWIKSSWANRLDAKSIEDNVYNTCSDIVANCVVVGNGRPFPALFVEPHATAVAESAESAGDILKYEIIKRLSGFHALQYIHERIEDARMIKIVPSKSLPRTAIKGNIRRRAVEQEFAKDLEDMYASISAEEVYASILEIPEPAATLTKRMSPNVTAAITAEPGNFSARSGTTGEGGLV